MIHIVMYHYVRNNEDYSYDCYARRFSEFESQIEFLSTSLDIVSPGDIEKIEYYLQQNSQSACLLTFDDGYKDHLLCSEVLRSKNLSGIFFPPINAIKGELLDVNAIHYLIGERSISVDKLLEYIASQVREKGLELHSWTGLPISIDDYLKQDGDCRYDDASTRFVKRLLQRDIIGDSNRRDVICECMRSLSDLSTTDHAKSLYLSADEMQQMRGEGMYFGSHGLTHRWLNTLQIHEQQLEISKSFEELEKLALINPKHDPKVMCYPYGAYNSDTISILIDQEVSYSLTTNVGAATGRPSETSMHQLKRWDTNDFWNNKWRKPVLPMQV